MQKNFLTAIFSSRLRIYLRPNRIYIYKTIRYDKKKKSFDISSIHRSSWIRVFVENLRTEPSSRCICVYTYIRQRDFKLFESRSKRLYIDVLRR